MTAVLKNASSDDEMYIEFYYAIDLIIDLAALLLECKVNKSVDLCELAGYDLETDMPNICITAEPEEHRLINKVLADFVAKPLAYDLSEINSKDDMLEMAAPETEQQRYIVHMVRNTLKCVANKDMKAFAKDIKIIKQEKNISSYPADEILKNQGLRGEYNGFGNTMDKIFLVEHTLIWSIYA